MGLTFSTTDSERAEHDQPIGALQMLLLLLVMVMMLRTSADAHLYLLTPAALSQGDQLTRPSTSPCRPCSTVFLQAGTHSKGCRTGA